MFITIITAFRYEIFVLKYICLCLIQCNYKMRSNQGCILLVVDLALLDCLVNR